MRVVVALLGLAGATLYGSYSYFSPTTDRPGELAELTAIMTAGTPMATSARTGDNQAAPATTAAPTSAPRVFSPQQPLLTAPPPSPAAEAAGRSGVLATRRSDPFGDVPAVRTVPTQQPTAAPAAAAARIPSGRPQTEEARVALVRDLQRELRRVGCYDGEVTGSWGQSSRRAMTDFTGRVNASLPVDTPDYVLLALVQGHNGLACGVGCPNGTIATAAGRCQPRAIVAQGGGSAGSEATAESLEQRAAAMAGQLAKAPPRPRLTETGAFPPAPYPAQRPSAAFGAPAQAAAPQPPSSQTASLPPAQTGSAPLPGRMAIGALPPAEAASSNDLAGQLAAAGTAAAGVAAAAAAGRGSANGEGSSNGNGAKGTKSSPRRAASRDPYASYYAPPRASYERPAPSRPRNSGSLRNANNVRDFFFGPGRSSY